MTLKEIFDKKNVAVRQCRELLDRADKEGRPLSAEESAQYDSWEKDIEQCNADADALQKQQQRRALLDQHEQSLRQPVGGQLVQARGGDGAEGVAPAPDRRSRLFQFIIFNQFLRCLDVLL